MFGKRILLGITGGIAAYKIAYLIRLLKKEGAEVKCIMTPASCDFISPLVVATLSQNPVSIEFWNKETGVWTNHVELGIWADLFVIAPATANTISKMAVGTCDNLLLATYLSMKSKTIIAPAMDLDMYQHPTFKRNLKQLIDDGVSVIPATSGELASGLEGQGRMEEPENMLEFIRNKFQDSDSINKKHFLITAGPTYEPIDPVRFIGNHSSGKMGFELAKTCLRNGYEVTLISGPTNLELTHPNLRLIRIVTADEMLIEVQKFWSKSDIGIFAAAIADYKPKIKSDQKIKKSEENLDLELVKNPDIIVWSSENRSNNQLVIGFALETNNSIENALTKLNRKNLDMIILNSLENKEAGFKKDTNKITILDKHQNQFDFDVKSKSEVANDILKAIDKYQKS
ncbi:MAG: bifunctional phosphopantothenoylcysteine decarboxylase/phosphopantothenate--cysteine ligase CoaBC [Bacteroidetes bacterium]|nr:bifunctional phosphopantothenoylcysteine decarboxylase/phosphopantothenate--cysteine ligase CoaBC [Bacteroidota bacterium]